MKRLILTMILIAGIATQLNAQQDSLLQNAIRLATEGQADSAQSLARAWIARLNPSDSAYPEALYAAGVVAGETERALNFLRRISIEYARSEWADDALLRMSQLAFAGGQLRAAIRSAERILLDYPFSEILADAALWSGRSHLELGELDEGCPLLQRARDTAVDNFEVENQAGYLLQRCPSGGASTDSPSRGNQPSDRRGGTAFSVQVAAVQSAAAADEMMQRLHSQGYEPHVIRDSDGLLKVRVGRFPRRADAEALLAELRVKIGGSPFVVEGS